MGGPRLKQLGASGATSGQAAVYSSGTSQWAPGDVADEVLLSDVQFLNVTGTINTTYEDPDFSDFEEWAKAASSSASGRVDFAYKGRLGSGHTTISSIKLYVKGTGTSPQLDIQVYVEGNGGSNQYTGTYSSAQSAPGSATEITIPSGELTDPTPSSGKRYFVYVRAYLDSGESLYVSRPLARHT